MMMSMTGYGKKETQFEDKRISIEIRALNSKSEDINLRTPSYIRELDTKIRKRLSIEMNRGKIDLNIHIEFNGQNVPNKINTSVINSYIDQLESIGDSTISERLAIAMRLPDTLKSDRDILSEKEKNLIFKLLDSVIEDIKSYRLDEALANSLMDLEPTAESKISKMMKQKARREKQDSVGHDQK